MLIFYFLFIDDVGDFDLEVNYGISNSDFVLFNFVILGFFFEKCWDVFIVCFWFKVFMDISVVYFLFVFYLNEEFFFKLKYKEVIGRLSFKGYVNERYFKIYDFFGFYILGLNNYYFIIEVRKINFEIISILFSF